MTAPLVAIPAVDREALDRADRVIAVMARLLARLSPAPELVGGATPASHLAALVARSVYRPAIAVLGSQGRVAPRARLGLLGQEDAALAAPGGRVGLDLPSIFAWVASGRFAIWISPAQIDRQGNTNISRIGTGERPRPALVGSRGLPDDAVSLPSGLYYVPAHGPRSVVAQVDFVSGVGDRRRLPPGSRAPGRPAWLVTDLGVFDFAGEDGSMRAVAAFGPDGRDAIEAATPFALGGPPALDVIEPPTPAELAALGAFDPLGVRAVEFERDPDRARALRAHLRTAEEAFLGGVGEDILAGLGLGLGLGREADR